MAHQAIMEDAVSGQIQSELWRLGYKCTAYRLSWFSDKPFCDKSRYTSGPNNTVLDEPYVTSLGYKTACKMLDTLRATQL